MVSCSDFLREYSEYRDGEMDLARSIEAQAHLASCSLCAGYHSLVEQGLRELHALDRIEPSDDFLPRLQHRLYHLAEEEAGWSRRNSSGSSIGFVLLLASLIGSAAWLPLLRSGTPLVELPPVVAAAPKRAAPIHTLFRAGPLLPRESQSVSLIYPPSNTVFFRYTPLGSYAGYQAASIDSR